MSQDRGARPMDSLPPGLIELRARAGGVTLAALVLIFRLRSFREVLERGREHRRQEASGAKLDRDEAREPHCRPNSVTEIRRGGKHEARDRDHQTVQAR